MAITAHNAVSTGPRVRTKQLKDYMNAPFYCSAGDQLPL